MRKFSGPLKVRIPGRRALALLALAALLIGVSPVFPAGARAGEYDPDEAGNPVHFAGTVAYPAGFLYEVFVLKPGHWLGRHTPFRQFFGEDTFDEAYDW
ncbi:MAG: hypothetical protein ACE5FC_09115 [Myxococcota bacterium]